MAFKMELYKGGELHYRAARQSDISLERLFFVLFCS